MADAEATFWALEKKVETKKKAVPIPGTSTFQARVQADGIFACTFSNGTALAENSQARITDEKRETLQQQQKFMPYEQARAARNGR